MTKDDWASFDYSGDRASDALAYLFDSGNIDLLSEIFDNFVVERTAPNPGQVLVTLSTDIGNTLNADIYMYGNTVVKKDVSKAIKLYEESAQMGHIESKATLGSIYLRGESVKKDLSKSFFYLEQSALWENRNSWILMGVLYSMKDFSKYDLVKAGAWLTLYLEEGKLDKKKRDKLRNRNSDYPIDINLDDLSIGKRTKIKFTIPKEQIKSMFDIVDDIKKQIEIQQTTSVK